MKQEWVWPRLLELVKLDARPLGLSLIGGFALSLLTGTVEFILRWPQAAPWFLDFGQPVAWMGVWRRSVDVLNAKFYFYWSPFLQNCLFWASIAFASIVVYNLLRGRLTLPMLPIYVVLLSSARIQLEYHNILAMGGLFGLAQVNPSTYPQITAYFAMALLLFPDIIALVSKIRFLEIFKLSCLGFPIILMPPTVDYYVLNRPVIYNFFTSETFAHATNPVAYLSVLSGGIKLEIVLVAAATFAYLLYRTRSILRPIAAVLVVLFAFVLVSTPALTSRLNLSLTAPQYFAGYLILTYLLIIVSFGLAYPKMGSTILRRMRLRGIHFPAMTLFGVFLVHPSILSAHVREDYGFVLAGAFIVFLVWQTAAVFDDIYDRGEQPIPAYLGYGMLTALMAPLAAIPFGLWPLLLTLLAVYLALDYPRLRRKHFLMSGIVIGASTCAAFLFGALIPISGQPSSQPIGAIALAIFAVFSGGSLLKDITSVKQDTQAGIPNIFTRFDVNKALPAVATFVAAGMMLPVVFLRTPLDLLVFLATGVGSWLLIVLAKDHCYKPVLVLYFLEGAWVFLQMFVK